jgi:hypothetical protein
MLLSILIMTGLNSTHDQTRTFDTATVEQNHILDERDINKGDYVLQGITMIDDYIVITSYNDDCRVNSKLMVYDTNFNFVKDIELYNSSHVGGITYDDEHEIIWITDVAGRISGYHKDELLYLNNNKPLYEKLDLSENLVNIYGNTAVAYICYHDGYLYLGDYTLEDFSTMKSYKINNDGSINPMDYKLYHFFGLVQGLTFFEQNGNTYMCVSSSISRVLKSNIKICKFDPEITNYRDVNYVNIELPNMLEQIYVDGDHKLYTVYESNSEKYKKNIKNSDDLITIDLDDVLDTSSAKIK